MSHRWTTRDDLIRRARDLGAAALELYRGHAREAAWQDARQVLFEEMGERHSMAAWEAARAAFLAEFARPRPGPTDHTDSNRGDVRP